MKTIYSIGHSNKTEEEFIAKLQENGITDLVDVRTYPGSKWNPQFGQAQLERYLPAAGIKYHYRGKNLGGLGRNVLFKETIAKLIEASSDTRKFAVMCSEADPADCHRTSTILPEVNEQGAVMHHIRWLTKTERVKLEKEEAQPGLL